MDNNILDKNKTRYFPSIDFVKGVLIILVFLGHIIPGKLTKVFPRYFIYAFHMPLFIGISGFLINFQVFNSSVKNLITKYWSRLLFPWIIAVIIYLIANHTFSLKGIITGFLHPFYHLWYILGFISYIVIFFILWNIFKKLKYKWVYIFIITILISVMAKWNIPANFLTDKTLSEIWKYIQYDLRLQHFIFFVLGIFLRYIYDKGYIIKHINIIIEALRIVLCLSFIFTICLFFNNSKNFGFVLFFILNFSFLITLLYDCTKLNVPRSFIFEFLGKYTLPIYLYHVLCKLFAGSLFKAGSLNYYILSTLTFIILCFIIYLFKDNKWMGKIFYGK